MYQVIIIGHVLVGLAVIGLVLMQHGKGADAGAAFGSGSSGTVFGAQGSASFLSRTTAVLAAVFFSTSLGLAMLSGNSGTDADIMDTPVVESLETEMPIVDGEQVIVDEPVIDEAEVPEAVVIEDVVTEEAVPTIETDEIVIEDDVVTP
ncbi:preprotein translocase subunit SecG [Bathymodiolus japonicus methanotrophic gill symbiont]|uniref:preprotein translocase subunit SecG n=1 Tax=Bathymodiolus japonicus methanotrophic gill symbiont TaxID=113269 RepID=UPI001B4425F2|nr:preprotein translocase subunit SecG [Bathymodiolus japonicus methanotrophic gill symbiont]GFO72443.1 preprotein translocase subunit SecG [Bathymodiolus japonicus methanotrophic gill symbiont]